MVVLTRSPAIMAIGGAMFGAGNGAATLLRAIGVRDVVGGSGYASVLGRIAAFPVVARALAPIAAGLLATLGGMLPFAVSVGALGVCCLVGPVVPGFAPSGGERY